MGTKKVFCFLCLLVVMTICATFLTAEEIVVAPIPGLPDDFMRGADVSMLAEIEECGGKYFDADGKEKDLFVILKENGVNWIRLRVWNNPVDDKGVGLGGGNNDLARTIALGKRAKDAGFKLLVDFHYSDFWADPARQTKPAAWKDMNAEQLEKAVYDFTLDSMKQLVAAGAKPDMVQTGNELNGGMLWPEGKTWKDVNDVEVGGIKGFAKFLTAAGKAIREIDPSIKIAIHLANGGDNGLYRSIFDGLKKEKVDYDAIGLSFYPYWHGSMAALEANVSDLAKRYKKEMYIAETAYGYTEDDFDEQGNVFMVYSDDNFGYEATVQGQATVVRDVMASIFKAGGNLGRGVFYWEPGWIPVKGAGWKAGEGNNWDNQAMFDKDGKVLESIKVFNKIYDKTEVAIAPKSFEDINLKIAPKEKTKKLPSKAKIIYSDDSIRLEPITWDAYDFSSKTEIGTFNVEGTLEGSSFRVKANVEVSDQVNLITDTSFETGKLGEWKINGPGAASFLENNKTNARNGSWTYKYWLGSGFKTQLIRTFKDLPNGSYSLSIWAMGGGGEKAIKLFATNPATKKTASADIKNTGWKEWKQYTIPNIQVTNNQCTIGIYLDTNADCWGNFDDIEFYQNKGTVALKNENDDDISVPINEDLTNAVAVAATSAGPAKPTLLQGLWIEATSHNTSIIRDIATGEKPGYEFDKSVLSTKANWWFWGDVSPKFHLDAEVALWNINHTMYKADSFAANVPEVTVGDGLQGLLSMFFSPIVGLNEENPGILNKMGFTIKTPFLNTRLGYGDLQDNTMTGFTGIFNVIDRWDNVGDGFIEFTPGAKAKRIGDNVELNILLALSRMRGEYGMYSILGATIFDKVKFAMTFTSTTTSSELFRYDEQNDNAASLYFSFDPIQMLKFELHGLTAFGTEIESGLDASAFAMRITFEKNAHKLILSESYAGSTAATIWGYDDSVNIDSSTTSLMYWYKNDLFAAGIDGSFKMNTVDDLKEGLWNIRVQPMFDFNWKSIIENDMTTSIYGVVDVDRIDAASNSEKPWTAWFEEAGIEIVLTDFSATFKKLTFDYAACPTYKTYDSENGYDVNIFYHSLMVSAQFTDTVTATLAGIYRGFADEADSNQPLGLAAGVAIKTDIKFLGSPKIWMHMTYGMDPYEDVNDALYRYDDPNNKLVHRTYRLNSVDQAMEESRISLGFIWDIK